MTDPLSLATVRDPAAAAAPTQPRRVALDPGDTRLFAQMMNGTPPPGAQATFSSGSLGDAAQAYAAQLTGHSRSLEDIRRSMLESVDFNDPLKTMFAMTDHSMQAHMSFAKLHISTGLASAATSLFGSLLKNQQ
ncbi:MAG TPA: hypothetical protein VFL86_28140 [Burkholderiaceae bacterium]|nr:hypothetical protein [Burkholderiaceae bacterium]